MQLTPTTLLAIPPPRPNLHPSLLPSNLPYPPLDWTEHISQPRSQRAVVGSKRHCFMRHSTGFDVCAMQILPTSHSHHDYQAAFISFGSSHSRTIYIPQMHTAVFALVFIVASRICSYFIPPGFIPVLHIFHLVSGPLWESVLLVPDTAHYTERHRTHCREPQ